MTIKLDSAEGANLLNIQYGVCFGTIFALVFQVASAPPNFDITLAFSYASPFSFVALLLYFFVDWAFANFLKDKITEVDPNLWTAIGVD